MTTNATIGYNKLEVQAYGGSPVTYQNVEEVRSVGGIGHTGTQVDVTNFDSAAGYREFIAGLKEGNAVTVTCNRLRTGNTQQLSLIASAVAGQNRNFRLRYTGASPELVTNFAAAVLGYSLLPSSTDPNTIEFQLKISGALS